MISIRWKKAKSNGSGEHGPSDHGDSNTYGYDLRSCLGGRYPETVHWTVLLSADGWTVINEGENGRSIPRLDREIEAAKPIILV